jgi:hypothetical protein
VEKIKEKIEKKESSFAKATKDKKKPKEKSVKERLKKDNELLRVAEMYDWYEIS